MHELSIVEAAQLCGHWPGGEVLCSRFSLLYIWPCGREYGEPSSHDYAGGHRCCDCGNMVLDTEAVRAEEDKG
ncbi:hypothetical protein D3C80_2027360 [compost metagenome]